MSEPIKNNKHNRWTRLKRLGRYWYLRIVRQSATPHNIALGLALGVFVGALPIIPFQTVTVIVLAFILKVNKLSSWLATCYSNVFTMVPFYSFLFVLGKFFFPFEDVYFDPSRLEMEQILSAGWDLFVVMCAGAVAFGIPASFLTYFLSLKAVKRYRLLKLQRRKNRRS